MEDQNTKLKRHQAERGPLSETDKNALSETSEASETPQLRPKKRRRKLEPDIPLESDQLPKAAGDRYSEEPSEILRGLENANEPPSHRYLVLHRVSCLKSKSFESDHSDHEDVAHYLDPPRLSAKDTRGSALRGRSYIANIEEYLADQERIAFVVYKNYHCLQYHRQVSEQFVNVAPANIDRNTFLRLKPWFHVLQNDAKLADTTSEEISIIQTGLAEAFEELAARDAENLGFWKGKTSLRAPYDYFYHCHQSIRDLAESESDLPNAILASINLLVGYVQAECETQWANADKLLNQGLVTTSVFSKLFRPGEIVIQTEDGIVQAYMVEDIDSHSVPRRTKLTCWSLVFDGKFRRRLTQIPVDWRGEGEEVVTVKSLAAWPLRVDKTGLQDQLTSRGIKFWHCRGKQLVTYRGPQSSNFELVTGSPKFMVDIDTYKTLHPQRYSGGQEYEDFDMSKDAPPPAPFLLLMPATIPGFGFHDKKWNTLQVDHIRKAEWNENAFNRLVLKANKKELIQALVTIHLENNQATDIIKGKGAGLIMLLHGPPGSGKTLTAETVAELANKPLYRVTCGDIGTEPEGVEKYLESALYLGTIWDCVVLLDEADVFLEERTQNDLARNALVSVFLRVLEYFNGILILTSNRVGLFDEAFKSRMQLAIRYPPLDEPGRFKIWDSFFSALNKAGVDMEFEDLSSNVASLARKALNGRQIRNVIKTARQLAAFRHQKFGNQHLECAIEVMEEFEQYLVDTRGPDDYYARQQRLRLE